MYKILIKATKQVLATSVTKLEGQYVFHTPVYLIAGNYHKLTCPKTKRSKVQHNPNHCLSPLNLISSIYHHEVIKSRHPRSHPPHSTHRLTYSSFRKIKHKKVTKGNDQEEWVVLYANIPVSTLVRMQGHNWLD